MGGRWSWTNIAPVGALLVLVLEWGRTIPTWAALLSALILGAAVMSGVHHAEVIAHRLGEPRTCASAWSWWTWGRPSPAPSTGSG